MKKLIFIGGPMGVGKTSVSKKLQEKLNKCVYLDGDWCWFTNPWILTESTKNMVIKNIAYLLNNYIECPDYDNVILSWVLYDNQIINDIKSRIKDSNYDFYNISLIASENILIGRLNDDLNKGIRSEKIVIERSLERLKHYPYVDSIKIDTSLLSIDEICDKLLNIINRVEK